MPYNIETSLEFDITELCKLYGVRLEQSGDTLVERIIDYIRAMNQLCGYSLFILLNFYMYLSEKDLKELFEYIAYQKIYTLMIEFSVPKDFKIEKACIIDGDGCMIDIGDCSKSL